MNEAVFNKLNWVVFVVLLGLITLQAGCKKEEKDTLNGTVWKYTEDEDGFSGEETVLFQESTFTVTITIVSEYYNANIHETGTYVYNHPNITLHITTVTTGDKSVEGSAITGAISGNKMTLYADDGTPTVFTKQ